jgi:hypothetical protein
MDPDPFWDQLEKSLTEQKERNKKKKEIYQIGTVAKFNRQSPV